MILVWLAKFIAAFNANTRPGEIGFALGWAFLLALVPAGNLLWMGLFVLSFFFKHNQAVCMTALAFLKLVVPALDPAVDAVGWAVLNHPGFQETFRVWAGTPLVPWTGYNETLVMGGAVLGLAALIPVFALGTLLVVQWRRHLRARVVNNPLTKALGQAPIIKPIAGLVSKLFNLVQEYL